MGHFIGVNDVQYFVEDGVVYSDSTKLHKVADSEAEIRAAFDKVVEDDMKAEKERKKEKKDEKVYNCKVCGKKGLKGKRGFGQHMRVHNAHAKDKEMNSDGDILAAQGVHS